MRPAETLLLVRTPIQDGELSLVTPVARTLGPGDVKRVVVRHVAAGTLQGRVFCVPEMQVRKLHRWAGVCDPMVIPARMSSANTSLLVGVIIQDRKGWIVAYSSTTKIGHKL